MSIIGQNKLQQKISTLSLDNFNHTNLFIGPSGSGKHFFANIIAKKLNLEYVDITEKLNMDDLNALCCSSILYLCVIDVDKISIKDQNTILKFVEEPQRNIFIVLLTENINNVIATIQNRCYKVFFEPYTKEQLSFFNTNNINEYYYSVLDTPGKIISTNNEQVEETFSLCKKLIDKFDKANFSNLLSIADKINYVSVENTNIELFVDFLLFAIKEKIKESNDVLYFDIYKKISDLSNKLKNKTINKKYAVINFLSSLRL